MFGSSKVCLLPHGICLNPRWGRYKQRQKPVLHRLLGSGTWPCCPLTRTTPDINAGDISSITALAVYWNTQLWDKQKLLFHSGGWWNVECILVILKSPLFIGRMTTFQFSKYDCTCNNSITSLLKEIKRGIFFFQEQHQDLFHDFYEPLLWIKNGSIHMSAHMLPW